MWYDIIWRLRGPDMRDRDALRAVSALSGAVSCNYAVKLAHVSERYAEQLSENIICRNGEECQPLTWHREGEVFMPTKQDLKSLFQ
jgi:hypothetical protein